MIFILDVQDKMHCPILVIQEPVFSTGSKITPIASLYWVHSNLATGIELARGDECTCITA